MKVPGVPWHGAPGHPITHAQETHMTHHDTPPQITVTADNVVAACQAAWRKTLAQLKLEEIRLQMTGFGPDEEELRGMRDEVAEALQQLRRAETIQEKVQECVQAGFDIDHVEYALDYLASMAFDR